PAGNRIVEAQCLKLQGKSLFKPVRTGREYGKALGMAQWPAGRFRFFMWFGLMLGNGNAGGRTLLGFYFPLCDTSGACGRTLGLGIVACGRGRRLLLEWQWLAGLVGVRHEQVSCRGRKVPREI